MRNSLILPLLLCSILGQSQSELALDIVALKQDHTPQKLNIFSTSEQTERNIAALQYHEMVAYTAPTSETLDEHILIEVPVQFQGENLNLTMISSDILSGDFVVRNALDEIVDVPLGRYYWGMVNDDPNSLVAMSFFDDEVIAVLATPEKGNIVIGKTDDLLESEHVIYLESDIAISNPNVCNVEDTPILDENISGVAASQIVDQCKNVGIYFEADNIMYRDKQSNITSVTQYVTGMYNVVALLYDNEEINTDITELKVWNTPDSYRKDNSRNCLNDFTSAMGNSFNGDLAHLLTTSRTNIGGRAWVGVLCSSRNRAAISNISNSYRNFPSYSWTVEVVAHEMGHNLGSRHTHYCTWGPNRNEAIDNCANPEPAGACTAGPPATGGGTIMSYCHLTSFGINFTKGFGDEPGDLVRQRVAAAGCLGGAFEAEASVTGETIFYLGDSTLLKASPIGPAYDHQWMKDGQEIPGAISASLTVKESGTYLCRVTTNCFEETNSIDVDVVDFLVSLKCPPVDGPESSVSFVSDTLYFDTEIEYYTVTVPEDLYNSIPQDAEFMEVDVEVCATKLESSNLIQLSMEMTGPNGTNVRNQPINKHRSNGARVTSCDDYPLGDVNPSGDWTFAGIDGALNNPGSPEAYAIITFKQKWRGGLIPSPCNAFICDGQVITLDAGFPDLTYRWSTGETTQTIEVTDPGVYGVTVSNGPFERSDEIEIIETPEFYALDTTICSGEVFALGNIDLQETGVYRDTFTSFYGCDSVLMVDLTVKPKNETLLDTFLCYLDTLDGIVYNFSYYKSDQFTGADGCDSFYTIDIQVNPEINLSFDVNRGCEDTGGQITANGTGGSGSGFTYTWSTGDIGQVLQGAKSGLVTCIATDDKGCSFTRSVSIGNYDSVGVEVVKEDNICFGDEVGRAEASTFSGRRPFEFMWSNGETTALIEGLASDDYTLLVTDANDCTKEVVISIDENDEMLSNPTITSSGVAGDGSITLEPTGGVAPYTYVWLDGPTTKDRTGLFPGGYTVDIKDSEDCIQRFDFEVEMRTSIAELDQVNEFSAFPNPVGDVLNLNLELKRVQDVSFTLLTFQGQVVRQMEYSEVSKVNSQIMTDNLPKGVYLLRVALDGEEGAIRIIK